jgi:hypothetical protein
MRKKLSLILPQDSQKTLGILYLSYILELILQVIFNKDVHPPLEHFRGKNTHPAPFFPIKRIQ